MLQRGDDTCQVCVSDDILGRLGTKRVVQGDAIERLRHASQIGKLPFRSILAPQAHTILCTSDSLSCMKLDQACTESCPTLLNSLVVYPFEGAIRFLGRVVRSISKARRIWCPRHCRLKHVMSCPHGWVEGFQEAIARKPVSVDFTSAILLRVWQWY